MNRSPDHENSTTSAESSSSGIHVGRSVSPLSSSVCIREKESPTMFVPANKSPFTDVIRRGSSPMIFPPYPIVIPTVRRTPINSGAVSRSPDSRSSRSPVSSCVPVITTSRRGSSPVGIPSSSSPGYERRSPPSPQGIIRCRSPTEEIADRLEMSRSQLTYNSKTCRESPPRGSTFTGRYSASDDGSNAGTSSTTDSRQLKFGMERILSKELSPVVRRHQHQEPMVMSPSVPCSECVSSLLRCCRLSAPGCESTAAFCTPYSSGYYTTLHTPRAMRPYTNILAADAVHMSTSDHSSTSGNSSGTNKRKRSWSRAVFSNLQRKGLEKRFQLQKYITKPDRRQLAATLGLTDAQVKVWFQNRRMKWRHSKEAKHQQSGSSNSDNRSTREEQGGPDSTQEPEIDIQNVDS